MVNTSTTNANHYYTFDVNQTGLSAQQVQDILNQGPLNNLETLMLTSALGIGDAAAGQGPLAVLFWVLVALFVVWIFFGHRGGA